MASKSAFPYSGNLSSQGASLARSSRKGASPAMRSYAASRLSLERQIKRQSLAAGVKSEAKKAGQYISGFRAARKAQRHRPPGTPRGGQFF